MQTFLPYPDFLKSAQVLDKKRCWKQVIEAKQIINTLVGMQSNSFKELNQKLQRKQHPWMNHPAVKMWESKIWCLKYYFNIFLEVCIDVHKIKTKYERFLFYGNDVLSILMYTKNKKNAPWWLGNEDFHRSHRARLIEKDKEFYLPKFPNDAGFNNGKYLWPNNETRTFKII